MDDSVSPLSAGYLFYIPEFHISFSNNLPPITPSFTAERFAIIDALNKILFLPPNNFLIATDSLSCLQALTSNAYNSHISPLIITIRQLLYSLTGAGMDIQFLWIPEHTGIVGNEFADKLAKASASIRCPMSSKIPWSDFIRNFRTYITNLRLKHWESFPPYFVTWYKIYLQNISPIISPLPWFHNLNLSRRSIVSFFRLRFGHTLIPSHSFKRSLNDSSLCTFHNDTMICDITHPIFNCPAIHSNLTAYYPFSTPLTSLSTPNIASLVNKKTSLIRDNILYFFNCTGFLI